MYVYNASQIERDQLSLYLISSAWFLVDVTTIHVLILIIRCNRWYWVKNQQSIINPKKKKKKKTQKQDQLLNF